VLTVALCPTCLHYAALHDVLGLQRVAYEEEDGGTVYRDEQVVRPGCSVERCHCSVSRHAAYAPWQREASPRHAWV
jgi:hypothetical protein